MSAAGFTGARRILDGAQGMAAGMSRDADPARLTDGLGTRWALAETSFKFHASCRHTHPAADAQGYVKRPNVDSMIEMMDMREAQRSYSANLAVLETTRGMLTRTIEALR